jgi:hypothetical protein
MPYTVVFTPKAENQLAAIYQYIAAAAASPAIAERFTSVIVSYCKDCATLIGATRALIIKEMIDHIHTLMRNPNNINSGFCLGIENQMPAF